MNQAAEQKLRDIILPDLEKGRVNFDKPHTEAVVAHIKDIIQHSSELNLDEEVLITGAYAHDWGYTDLFKDAESSRSYEDIKKAKPLHMKLGAEKIQMLLRDDVFEYLSDSQKDRIVHLVRIHDKLRNLRDIDELILMEADTLGAIDISKVEPGFDKETNEKYMNNSVRFRRSLFISKRGKELIDTLIEERNHYYNNL